MQPDRLSRRITTIERLVSEGRRVKDLMKIVVTPALWERAYANIYANKGAVTKGIDSVTQDGFSTERAANLIGLIVEERYRPKPVRRTEIPKANGRTRPLGIPSGDDKLVQEVVRMILERIYEPIFSINSHGFRPKRSVHTALQRVQNIWTGTKWFVNIDIHGYFEHIDHATLIQILEKRIDDKRFMALIRLFLNAGYMEDWTFYRTYSGTPQGGVVSPILANIYLHELDEKVREIGQAYTKGTTRKRSPAYRTIEGRLRYLRARIASAKKTGDIMGTNTLMQEYRDTRLKLGGTQAKDQMDPEYRRLNYIRYCDDFLIGTIGPKEEAHEIFDSIRAYLKDALKLDISESKSGIHHAQEGITYLGYGIRVRHSPKRVRMTIQTVGGPRHLLKRTLNADVELYVPEARVIRFCHKNRYGNLVTGESKHVPGLIYRSDAEIVAYYNAQLRGFAHFYALASDAKGKLRKLQWVWKGSLLKTFAAKHKTTVSKVAKHLRHGRDYGVWVAQRQQRNFIRLYALRTLKHPDRATEVDRVPNVALYWSGRSRSELMERLNRNACEYCGKEGGYTEAHHVKKLKDVKEAPGWKQVMIAMRRKVIIVCTACHDQIHHGTLPSWMRRARSNGEPCVSKGTRTVRREGVA